MRLLVCVECRTELIRLVSLAADVEREETGDLPPGVDIDADGAFPSSLSLLTWLTFISPQRPTTRTHLTKTTLPPPPTTNRPTTDPTTNPTTNVFNLVQLLQSVKLLPPESQSSLLLSHLTPSRLHPPPSSSRMSFSASQFIPPHTPPLPPPLFNLVSMSILPSPIESLSLPIECLPPPPTTTDLDSLKVVT